MSEIVSLDEVRVKLKATQAAIGNSPPLTDGERLNITVESMKLAYQAILEIFERLETLGRAPARVSRAARTGATEDSISALASPL